METLILLQYSELNRSELREITAETPSSVIVIPRKFADKGFADFCVPQHLVDGHVLLPKFFALDDGTPSQHKPEDYLDKWVPIVNTEGKIDHMVLTHSNPRKWAKEDDPAKEPAAAATAAAATAAAATADCEHENETSNCTTASVSGTWEDYKIEKTERDCKGKWGAGSGEGWVGQTNPTTTRRQP